VHYIYYTIDQGFEKNDIQRFRIRFPKKAFSKKSIQRFRIRFPKKVFSKKVYSL